MSITTDSSSTTLSVMEAALENQIDLNYTRNGSRNTGDTSSGNASGHYSYDPDVMRICIFVISILGAVGNGIVIWLLGIRVQRNPFMPYILNLAMADCGLLISTVLFQGPFQILPDFLFLVDGPLFFLTLSAGQFLLTAISLDWCVAVFFPLCHRCHRSPHMSAIVCALMWVLSLILVIITIWTCFVLQAEWSIRPSFQFIVNAVLCLPIMTVSSLALFVKVCFKPRQHRRGKLLTILLLTLAFFLLFAFPFNVIFISCGYSDLPAYVEDGAILLACLNSSVNPVIYFLVGRHRKTRRRQSLKMILQRAFKEEEEEGCTEEAPAETQF